MHRSLAALVTLLLLAATAVPAVAQEGGGGSQSPRPDGEEPCEVPCVGPCEDSANGTLDEDCLEAYCAGREHERERGGGRNGSETRGGTRGEEDGGDEEEDNRTRQDREGQSRGRSGQACLKAYCDAYPEASGCRPHDTPSAGAACAGHNATTRSDCVDAYCEDNEGAAGCGPRGQDKRDEGRPPEDLCDDGRCDAWKDGASGLRWIDFDTDGPGNLTDYRVGGDLVLEALSFDTGSSQLDLARGTQSLVASDNDTTLTLHDNPTGLLRFKGGDGSLTLTFPADVSIGEPERGADATSYQIRYADGTQALLRVENGTWDGASIKMTRFAAFHVPASDARGGPSATVDPTGAPGRSGDAPGQQVQERVHEAIQNGRLGAEVAIGRQDVPDAAEPPTGAVAPIADAPGAVLAYDDVEVTVDPIPERATPEAPVRIVVSANLSEGRTISLVLDPSLFPGTETVALDEALDLRYYDLHDDGTETEVVFRQAASLEDALDATDDGGQPEYWVVRDQDGLHVLVSVPHWSAHAITLASAVEVLAQPSVVIGVVAGLGGAGIASVLMLWPRRREED